VPFLFTDGARNNTIKRRRLCSISAWLAESIWRLATDWTVWKSNPGWGRDFMHSSKPGLGHTLYPMQWVPGSFPDLNQPGDGVHLPSSSSAEVKERVEL